MRVFLVRGVSYEVISCGGLCYKELNILGFLPERTCLKVGVS